MTDLIEATTPDAFETEWVSTSRVEAFLTSWPTDRPVNLVGSTAAALAARLAMTAPDLMVKSIMLGAPSDGNRDSVKAWSQLAEVLTPRGSTVVLNPISGQWLAHQPDLLSDLALKTYDRLLLPLFVRPPTFQVIFSDEFSFEEPLNNDKGDGHWCWCISDQPALVLIQADRPLTDHVLEFTLTSALPGMFVCTVNGQIQAFTATPEHLAVKFSFPLRQTSALVGVNIKFIGEPLIPDPSLDQRKALYFSYSGTALEPKGSESGIADLVQPPQNVQSLHDRSVRRALHTRGFFEVQTLATPWSRLSALSGVRSCYDYQSGFSYRDTSSPYDDFGSRQAWAYAVPAIWYQARRMPSPGSEWLTANERLAAALERSAGLA